MASQLKALQTQKAALDEERSQLQSRLEGALNSAAEATERAEDAERAQAAAESARDDAEKRALNGASGYDEVRPEYIPELAEKYITCSLIFSHPAITSLIKTDNAYVYVTAGGAAAG